MEQLRIGREELATLKRTVEINDEMYKLTLADLQVTLIGSI